MLWQQCMKRKEHYSIDDGIIADVVVNLIRIQVDHEFTYNYTLEQSINWKKVVLFAKRQGVNAILFDSIALLPDSLRPTKDLLLNWIGEVIAQENLYEHHKETIINLSDFFNRNGLKMMLLKGLGLSMNYPKPNHRPVGDVDIWLYGQQNQGDLVLSKELGITPIKSSHHTIFFFNNIEIENHITFIEADCHKADGIEELLLEYAKEQSCDVQANLGINVHLPSPNLNALFLLRHSSAHFSTDAITLRHLLDWGFFVQKWHKEIDWEALFHNAKERNIHIFLDCLNSICVNKLGFNRDCFPIKHSYPEIENRIYNDILYPEFSQASPNMRDNFIKYCFVKTKRLFINRWKYKITYKEHYISIFFRFALNRLKSPYSFIEMRKEHNL